LGYKDLEDIHNEKLNGHLTILEVLIRKRSILDSDAKHYFKSLVKKGIYDRGTLGLNMNMFPITSNEIIKDNMQIKSQLIECLGLQVEHKDVKYFKVMTILPSLMKENFDIRKSEFLTGFFKDGYTCHKDCES